MQIFKIRDWTIIMKDKKNDKAVGKAVGLVLRYKKKLAEKQQRQAEIEHLASVVNALSEPLRTQMIEVFNYPKQVSDDMRKIMAAVTTTKKNK